MLPESIHNLLSLVKEVDNVVLLLNGIAPVPRWGPPSQLHISVIRPLQASPVTVHIAVALHKVVALHNCDG